MPKKPKGKYTFILLSPEKVGDDVLPVQLDRCSSDTLKEAIDYFVDLYGNGGKNEVARLVAQTKNILEELK